MAVERASITTLETIYQPLPILLSLKKAPARYRELEADVTKNMRDSVFTYINDFIIFSTDKNSHVQILYNVIKAMDSFGKKLTSNVPNNRGRLKTAS